LKLVFVEEVALRGDPIRDPRVAALLKTHLPVAAGEEPLAISWSRPVEETPWRHAVQETPDREAK
jgi:hypothetical protein